MSVVPQLGPKAALLLGFLHAGPKTATELVELCEMGAAGGIGFATVRHAARCLADGGLEEVETILHRMTAHDWARSIPDPEGGALWVATHPSPASAD